MTSVDQWVDSLIKKANQKARSTKVQKGSPVKMVSRTGEITKVFDNRKQASEFFNVTVQTITKWIKTGYKYDAYHTLTKG